MLTYIVNQLKAKKIKVVKTKRLPPITINTGSLKFTIIREFLVDNLTSPKIKYAEKINFVGKTGNRYSIAIGYNPSKALKKAIDHTNELIAFLFYKSGYDGYYLLNLYPHNTKWFDTIVSDLFFREDRGVFPIFQNQMHEQNVFTCYKLYDF